MSYITIDRHDKIGFYEVNRVSNNLRTNSLDLRYHEISIDLVLTLTTDKGETQEDPQLRIMYLPFFRDNETNNSQIYQNSCKLESE